jgi:hypothetical protein
MTDDSAAFPVSFDITAQTGLVGLDQGRGYAVKGLLVARYRCGMFVRAMSIRTRRMWVEGYCVDVVSACRLT